MDSAKPLTMDSYRQKILGIIESKGMNLKEVSMAIGKNHAYLHQFIHKGTPRLLGETVRLKLARHLRVEEKELIHPDQVASLASITRMKDDSFTLVPVYNVHASAGHGAAVDQEAVLYHLSFRTEWLRRLTLASVDQLAVISVTGNSMEPTLSAEDTVLVDMTVRTPREDGIYVLSYDGLLVVKRLRIDPVRGSVQIMSDNVAYAPVEGVSSAELQVFGKVIWLGRKI
jgi:phage repressor protein C with HTH and peptisase S24 domain